MTDETKIKLMEALGKSGMSVGQLIIENTGSITYNDHRGAEKKEETKGECPSASKDAIMEYVNRLKPLVKVEYQAHYEKIWMCILEINEVKQQVYNKGKQQETTFNRNLVAQIAHQLGDRIYVTEAKPVNMAEYLEPGKGKEHPVRKKLGELPEKPIKKAIEEAIKDEL